MSEAAHPTNHAVHVAVDLTPVLPGGENGGAKLMTMNLLKQLGHIAEDWKFILITSAKTHDELAILDAHNMRRVCMEAHTAAAVRPSLFVTRVGAYAKRWLANILPLSVKLRLDYLLARAIRQARKTSRLRELGVDLLFCPFTAPFLHDPTVPLVAVVYDLQHEDYPQFFDETDRFHRRRHFLDACHHADRIICISDFVRSAVIQHGGIPSERVRTIYIQLPNRLEACSPDNGLAVLSCFSIQKDQFILYPANFWPHKNHNLLLTAYGMYLANNPNSVIKLVCTGAPNARMENMRVAAEKMGFGDKAIFTGYLTDSELSALMQSCLAVIFPSLYEGFGMPVIEAMAFGKPVLCSNVTSLPEIAGDAALLFDPRKPEQIAAAIERIQADPLLVKKLSEMGGRRVIAWGNLDQMARQYMQVFRDVLQRPERNAQGFYGVHADGWTSDHVQVFYDSDPEERHLEMRLRLPEWSPVSRVHALVVGQFDDEIPLNYVIKRGQTTFIRFPLSNMGGSIEFSLMPTFQPRAFGLGDDIRALGCQCQECWVISPSGKKNLLTPGFDQT